MTQSRLGSLGSLASASLPRYSSPAGKRYRESVLSVRLAPDYWAPQSMAKWEPAGAAAIIGLAGFQLLSAWNNNAPTLQEVRQAPPGDNVIGTQLKDADIMVGGLAVILGTTYLVLTKDTTAMFVMVGIWGSMSLWYHAVLKAEPARKE